MIRSHGAYPPYRECNAGEMEKTDHQCVVGEGCKGKGEKKGFILNEKGIWHCNNLVLQKSNRNKICSKR